MATENMPQNGNVQLTSKEIAQFQELQQLHEEIRVSGQFNRNSGKWTYTAEQARDLKEVQEMMEILRQEARGAAAHANAARSKSQSRSKKAAGSKSTASDDADDDTVSNAPHDLLWQIDMKAMLPFERRHLRKHPASGFKRKSRHYPRKVC
jgi:hypothetical protein